MEPRPEPRPSPRTYRGLQVASILLSVGGLFAMLAVVGANPGLLGAGELPSDDEAIAVLTGLVIAGFSFLLGLAMSIARAIVVRELLPSHRYRGPSIIVLLLLAIVAANVAAASVATDLVALIAGGDLSTIGSLVILTTTQLGLLAAVALFVVAPRALAGVRLLPSTGLWPSVGLGLVLAIPAWIGAQVIYYIGARLLELIGQRPESGIAEVALSRVDPLVLVVALVVVAPIAEEAFFRGVAMNAWLREYGPSRALYGSAVLFAIIHGSVFLFLPIVALGIALGVVYRATGSLPAAMALHAGFNAITLTLGLLQRYNVIDIPIR